MTTLAERYPLVRTLKAADGSDSREVTLLPMSGAHEPGVLSLAQSLPEHDLLFLRRNIAEPRVMSAWVRSIEDGTIASLVALEPDGSAVGCSAVVLDPHSFSRHVGELRVVLSPAVRAVGLGRLLIQESFLQAIALELRKLTVQMTADQDAAMAVFTDMGFRQEALLRDQVMDAAGDTHDLVVLGLDVERVRARRELYGMAEAFEE